MLIKAAGSGNHRENHTMQEDAICSFQTFFRLSGLIQRAVRLRSQWLQAAWPLILRLSK
jgi:hypothetical protein